MEPAVVLPNRLNDLKLPVTAVLSQSRGGWRWRMAARELIEDENVLSLQKIRQLFNHFFRINQKLLNKDSLEAWILHRDARSRLFGITAAQYRAIPNPQKTHAREKAMEHLQEHFNGIFQRRHDCIHNCDRPKVALQSVGDVTVEKKLYDIEFLVTRCQEAFLLEFPEYLRICGFGAVTRNRVCN